MLAVMLAGARRRSFRPARRLHAPHLTADRYVAADGTALPLAVWPAEGGPPKAVILGLHGFGDYRDAFEEPAEIWAKAGITTYAYDQRGFGESPTRGRWPGTDTLVEDAKAVAALLRAKPSRRAVLPRRREHGRRAGPGRRRSRPARPTA